MYFIAYEYNSWVVCNSEWTFLCCRVLVAAQGREGKLLRFPRNPVLYVHKIKGQMCTTMYSYAIQHIFGAIQKS